MSLELFLRSSFLLLALLCFGFTGCVGPARRVDGGILKHMPDREYKIGTIYIDQGHAGMIEVVDLFGSAAPHQIESFREEQSLNFNGTKDIGQFARGGRAAMHLDAVDVKMKWDRVLSAKLSSPRMLIDALNRPATGLYYNQDAERRWSQIRATLLGLLAEDRNRLYLCVGTDLLENPIVVLDGHGLDQATAAAIAEKLFVGLPLKLRQPQREAQRAVGIAIDGRIYKRVTMLQIRQADGPFVPRVEFSFDGVCVYELSNIQAFRTSGHQARTMMAR